jgi:3-phenylpropionate/cinnamic acid dioxygenase small subunit
MKASTSSSLEALFLQWRIEQFYFYEAKLLDERRFDEWLDLFADDLRYYMPMRTNSSTSGPAHERPKQESLSYFDDDKTFLKVRIDRLKSGKAWAEDPPSRTRHLISNVIILNKPDNKELLVESSFLVYRNRLEADTEVCAGKRLDRIRDMEDNYKIASREITLDQSVLLSKNLTIFF